MYIDLSTVRFTTLDLADQAIDLLNNKIGRSIGSRVQSTSMKAIARAVLDYYQNTGLWVAKKQPDGTYSIFQQKYQLEYWSARSRLSQLDAYGFTIADTLKRLKKSTDIFY